MPYSIQNNPASILHAFILCRIQLLLNVARKIDTCTTVMTINLFQQRCKNLKTVQSCATRCGNKCCVKNRLRTPCDTYRFFVTRNIALKVVVRNRNRGWHRWHMLNRKSRYPILQILDIYMDIVSVTL